MGMVDSQMKNNNNGIICNLLSSLQCLETERPVEMCRPTDAGAAVTCRLRDLVRHCSCECVWVCVRAVHASAWVGGCAIVYIPNLQ